MVKDIYLQRFDIEKQMKRDATVVLLGGRRRGKTTIMKNIAYLLRFLRAIALCGSLGAKNGFLEFMAQRFVCNGSAAKLREVVREHTKWVNKHPNVKLTEFETAIFIDDMAFSPQFMRSDELKELAMNGRNLGLFVAIAVQYMMEMSPSLRGNLDYVIMTKESSRTNREKIYKQYGGSLGSMSHFDIILDACTQNYGVLVIDTTATTSKVESYMYHFRANPHLPKWMLGQPMPSPTVLLPISEINTETEIENDNEHENDNNNENENERNNREEQAEENHTQFNLQQQIKNLQLAEHNDN